MLKKLWCCVGGNIRRKFGFINWDDNVNWPPSLFTVGNSHYQPNKTKLSYDEIGILNQLINRSRVIQLMFTLTRLSLHEGC